MIKIYLIRRTSNDIRREVIDDLAHFAVVTSAVILNFDPVTLIVLDLVTRDQTFIRKLEQNRTIRG